MSFPEWFGTNGIPSGTKSNEKVLIAITIWIDSTWQRSLISPNTRRHAIHLSNVIARFVNNFLYVIETDGFFPWIIGEHKFDYIMFEQSTNWNSCLNVYNRKKNGFGYSKKIGAIWPISRKKKLHMKNLSMVYSIFRVASFMSKIFNKLSQPGKNYLGSRRDWRLSA